MSTADTAGANTPRREKIVILGGGLAALSTAFELTSQPGWQQRYEITLHTLGWRLGGKCASSRGPNDRIEEHGIHLFMGSYFNAMRQLKSVYDELGRKPSAPLSSFETAFHPVQRVMLWEWWRGALRRWPLHVPANKRSPACGEVKPRIPYASPLMRVIAQVFKVVQTPLWWIARPLTLTRRMFLTFDFAATLVRGLAADDLLRRGLDVVDDENWSDWLKRHGAHPATVSSPIALNTINIAYQYPDGDASVAPTISATSFLRWNLQSLAFNGAFIYAFGAGSGETFVAPYYEVLKRRGVRFEFFNKVTNLRLDASRQRVAAIDIDIQAELKDPARGYDPLIEVDGLPGWPLQPHYEQLVQGEALARGDYNLESWWTPWQPVAKRTLEVGRDFDRVVFAISLGAVPHICSELMAAREPWRNMVKAMPTVLTQAAQLWFKKSSEEMGGAVRSSNPYNSLLTATYYTPINGVADLSHLLKWEKWPADQQPKSLWYFCGMMSEHRPQPAFTDHDYPQRMLDRVRYQVVQYLEACTGPLLPKATSDAYLPPGDPVSLDFSLLVDTRDPATTPESLRTGEMRIDSQFLRANIDPTERYVTSPPGSGKHRLKAWDSGFDNVVVAGDWIYTGVNFGCAEGTITSGLLASHALSGYPRREDVINFPPEAWPKA